jgi:hypothetical protein
MNEIKKDLFELFELDKMPIEKAEETLNRLSGLVFQSVLMRSLPFLSEEDLAQYEKIVDSKEKDGADLFKFLGEKVPEFNKIILEETGSLRRELAGELEK